LPENMTSKLWEVKVRKVSDLAGTRPQSESKAHSAYCEQHGELFVCLMPSLYHLSSAF